MIDPERFPDEALARLERRFRQHPERHPDLDWAEVQARLLQRPEGWPVLQRMESSGGEPDVIGRGDGSGGFVFCDCSAESPAGRRSLCFDDAALAARKEHKPVGSAVGMARSIGITILDEVQYRALQSLGPFDRKTSSWIATPESVRRLGGALFCDRRYDQVFTYHNGAESYYAARGFRGRVLI